MLKLKWSYDAEGCLITEYDRLGARINSPDEDGNFTWIIGVFPDNHPQTLFASELGTSRSSKAAMARITKLLTHFCVEGRNPLPRFSIHDV